MATFNNLLIKGKWNINELKSALENDHSTINDFDNTGIRPLQRVLKNKNCTVDIVKLLLQYGANPNMGNMSDEFPLVLSLLHNRDKEVTRSLILSGAQLNVNDSEGHSPLCIVLRNDPDLDLVQMLLDAGASVNDCDMHDSALQCAMLFGKTFKIKTSVCKLLVEKDNSVILELIDDRPLLCYALCWDTELDTIKYLLDSGSSLNGCPDHYSALICATEGEGFLKESTVQFLLDAGVKMGVTNMCEMHLALESRCYESAAIKLLYENQVDDSDSYYDRNHLLHSAVQNLHCKPDIVQYLIDQGANADGYDRYNHTPLYYALKNENCQAAVVQVLLDNSVVECSGLIRGTALEVALHLRFEIIEMLLKRGFRLETAMVPHNTVGNAYIILENALRWYDTHRIKDNRNHFKLLLKYAYLENPKFSIRDLTRDRKHYSAFSSYEKECKREIYVLQSNRIFQFIERYSHYKPQPKFDQLLRVLSVNSLPIYLDVICAAFGKKAVDARIQIQPIYFVRKGSPDRKVVFNYEIVTELVSYLAFEDKFRLLVALYDPSMGNYSSSEKEPRQKRRRLL